MFLFLQCFVLSLSCFYTVLFGHCPVLSMTRWVAVLCYPLPYFVRDLCYPLPFDTVLFCHCVLLSSYFITVLFNNCPFCHCSVFHCPDLSSLSCFVTARLFHGPVLKLSYFVTFQFFFVEPYFAKK